MDEDLAQLPMRLHAQQYDWRPRSELCTLCMVTDLKMHEVVTLLQSKLAMKLSIFQLMATDRENIDT